MSKNEWCPLHHLPDTCYDDALQKHWERMKSKFHECCPDQENWNVNEESRSIIRKDFTVGIHATAHFWHRAQKWV